MDVIQWYEELLSLPDALVYLMLFGFALLENLFPPFPGDTIVIFGGYLSGVERLSLAVTFLLVTMGSWSGFMIYYLLGRWLGRTRVHGMLERWVAVEKLHRVEAWVLRYGHWVVLGNRLLSGARSVISLTVGFVGLPPPVVSGFALAGCALWNILLVGSGYYIGEEWERVLELVESYNRVMLIVLVLLAAALLFRLWWANSNRH